jgi:hypothetical protein
VETWTGAFVAVGHSRRRTIVAKANNALIWSDHDGGILPFGTGRKLFGSSIENPHPLLFVWKNCIIGHAVSIAISSLI